MEFSVWQGTLAGVTGVVAMALLLVTMRMAGMTRLDLGLLLGSMVTPDPLHAKRLGWALQLLGGMGFGLAYAALLAAMDPSPQALPWTGGLLGLAHGMLVGVALGPLGALHPRAGPRASGCGELVRPPGLFGRHYGPMTPISLLAAHVLYAAVTVTLYSWLISGPVR